MAVDLEFWNFGCTILAIHGCINIDNEMATIQHKHLFQYKVALSTNKAGYITNPRPEMGPKSPLPALKLPSSSAASPKYVISPKYQLQGHFGNWYLSSLRLGLWWF
jgi:hypothetical protein